MVFQLCFSELQLQFDWKKSENLLPVSSFYFHHDTETETFCVSVPKKSESADIEEPKLENEGTNEEELNVHISPAPADRKSPTSRSTKVSLRRRSP